MISTEKIAKFLEGKNPKPYIVGIEASYGQNIASQIINDPVRGKYVTTQEFSPFVWFNDEAAKLLYDGKRGDIRKACDKFKVKITKLKTVGPDGQRSDRMDNGYKYMAKIDGAYFKLQQFFKQGGLDIYGEKHKRMFLAISPVEQYMIATGKRLFKGMDDYNDLHRLQLDLETTGLSARGVLLNAEEVAEVKAQMADPDFTEDLTLKYEFDLLRQPVRHKDDNIFQVGLKDNRGYEEIIEVTGDTREEREISEKMAIIKFFQVINELKPDIIAGYNSEFFDWTFIELRCALLGLKLEQISKTLDKSGYHNFKRVDKSIKLGGERENYRQTEMWGYNIVDVSHAVRRAKAINSNIKKWGLKYITEFSKLNKPNRVYVEGGKIHTIWADKESNYAFNEKDGKYYIIDDKNPLKEGYFETKGAFIIRRYLLDDLWETEKVDEVFNQASFLLSKIIPTSYGRSTTMGTAGIWKLIMAAWSYENRLAIPSPNPQKTFTGGLSRLLDVGYAKNVAKLDYAALYPNIELTWGIFPDVDVSGVMHGMLLYIASTRDEFKGKMNDAKALVKKYKTYLEENKGIMSAEEIKLMTDEIEAQAGLASMYDKKQLPIKILGNSFFGSLGAPHIFYWGDTDCAEETTCRGRQYLRLMVHFFAKKDFKPLVGDTDGFNFSVPDAITDYSYTMRGTHRFTEERAGETSHGLQSIVDEFNELYMIGRMGLDIDDICETTINFARKNYGNLINGKVKLVGNSIKSSSMPIYIEEFINKGVDLLLHGNGYDFVDLYQKAVDDIYNYRVPLYKIATKKNVKQTIKQYEADLKTFNKAGNPKARKAYMELLIANGVTPSLGGSVYYVNTGTAKSHGDAKTVKNLTEAQKLQVKNKEKITGKIDTSVILNCKLIPTEQIESDPDLTTDEYNVAKYLTAFNTRIHGLLVCFNPEIREKITQVLIKNKKTQGWDLSEPHAFTRKQCELTSGQPFEDEDQDTMGELLTMEDKEIEFWMRVNKEPNNLEDLDMDWPWIQEDYHERQRIAKIEGILFEKDELKKLSMELEVDEIKAIRETNILPKKLDSMVFLNVHDDEDGNPMIYLTSKKWDNDISTFEILFKYETWAEERVSFYPTTKYKKEKTFEFWLRNKQKVALAEEEYTKANVIKDLLIELKYDEKEISEEEKSFQLRMKL